LAKLSYISGRKISFGNVKDNLLEKDSDLKGYPLLKGDLGKG
jgi:hypothetical protein